MKKLKILFLVTVSAALLVTGCGKSDAGSEPQVEENFTLNNSNEETKDDAAKEASSEAPAEETDTDTPPSEGMVRSVVTNEWIDEEVAKTRPIAVMMPTDQAAQPQYNIGNAGVLYECMEEGSISRQLAVIEDWKDMEKIGNVRSCRLYYVYLATEWDPILVHFGGVYYMQDRITQNDINNISGTSEYGIGGDAPGSSAFFRSKDKNSPHNAYISGSGIENACASLNYSTEIRDQYYNDQHFNFAPAGTENTLEDAPGVKNASMIDLKDCFPVTKSALKYSEEDGVYYKSLHGSPQIDGATGEQLSFANVIVQNAYSETLDAKGYLAFKIHDTTRDGYYFTKGKAIHINWKKSGDYEPTRYYDDDGNEIVMNTGKTYIAVVQDGTEVRFE